MQPFYKPKLFEAFSWMFKLANNVNICLLKDGPIINHLRTVSWDIWEVHEASFLILKGALLHQSGHFQGTLFADLWRRNNNMSIKGILLSLKMAAAFIKAKWRTQDHHVPEIKKQKISHLLYGFYRSIQAATGPVCLIFYLTVTKELLSDEKSVLS